MAKRHSSSPFAALGFHVLLKVVVHHEQQGDECQHEKGSIGEWVSGHAATPKANGVSWHIDATFAAMARRALRVTGWASMWRSAAFHA